MADPKWKVKPLPGTENNPVAVLVISVVNVHGEERAFAKGYAVFCTQM